MYLGKLLLLLLVFHLEFAYLLHPCTQLLFLLEECQSFQLILSHLVFDQLLQFDLSLLEG